MSQTAKQSPLGVNVNASILRNIGLTINSVTASYIGSSKVNNTYTPGKLVNNTPLKWLTYAINDGYNRGVIAGTTVTTTTYDNLISIGQGVCEALGNSKPPTYTAEDPSGQWTSYGTPATTGYSISGNTNQGQSASWLPYNTSNVNNSITQWGFIRCYALQAWNEFNWNGGTKTVASATDSVQYKDFIGSFLTAKSFISNQNVSAYSMQESKTFLKGTYSNMNDLASGDITGVSLATKAFGQDCIRAGKVIDLSKIAKFGLPSVLLQTIRKYNTLTQSLVLALLTSGLSNQEIESISKNTDSVSKTQEQQIYGAFLIITGTDLEEILIPLNCKTQGLETLADLLNVKKLFPNSYQSLTVPMYNTTSGPTNSKTYYPIFDNNNVSSRLTNYSIVQQIDTIVPAGSPPIKEAPVKPLNIDQVISVPVVDPSGSSNLGELGLRRFLVNRNTPNN